MFRLTEFIKRIYSTAVSSPALDEYANYMSYETYINLYASRLSMYSSDTLRRLNTIMLRMLLPTLIQEDKKDYSIRHSYLGSMSATKGDSVEESVNAISETIRQVNESYSSFDKCIIVNTGPKKTVHTPLTEKLITLGYQPLDVKPYMTQNPFHKVDAFVSEPIQRVPGVKTLIIVSDNYNHELFDMAVVACIKAFGHPVPDEDLNLYITDPEAYLNKLVGFYNEYNKGAAERRKARAYTMWMERNKIADNTLAKLEQDRDNYLESIANRRRDIGIYQEKLDTVLEKIFAFTLAANSEVDKLSPKNNYAAYWVKNKAELLIDVHDVSDRGRVVLDVHTVLEYWDEKNYNRLMNASNGENCFNKCTPSMKKLLNEIFIEHTIKLHFITAIKVGRDILPEATRGRINNEVYPQNPHMFYYNCWGSNQNAISKALENQNYAAAVEQTISALCGLNMTDIAVLNRFMDDMTNYYYTYKFLEVAATGEFISPEDYINAARAEERKQQAIKEAEAIAETPSPTVVQQVPPVYTPVTNPNDDLADAMAVARQILPELEDGDPLQ